MSANPSPATATTPRGPATRTIPAQAEAAAVGIDLGSRYLRVWASGRPMVDVPAMTHSRTPLVRRGRVVDENGVAMLLNRLAGRYAQPVPAGSLLVVCRPILATAEHERLVRDLLGEVFSASRVLFLDAVRAAAIGAGARSGPLLVADVGAEITELAVVAEGRVIAARRRDHGIADEPPGQHDRLADTVAELWHDLQRDEAIRVYDAEVRCRPLLVTGGGGEQSTLAAALSHRLELPVRPAAAPRLAGARGAGLAAVAALRHARP
ncbi:cell shape-determining protein MreB [Catellatospora methionotrophica]|uniref:cell shape-determining protein MreB n=1 Tax=Catellatospora methionotrophica TaxID=121620 RepID=UPI0033EEB1F5